MGLAELKNQDNTKIQDIELDKSGTLDGFSERFSTFLAMGEVGGKGQKFTVLEKELSASRSSVHTWLTKDIAPKDGKLEQIIRYTLTKTMLATYPSVKRIAAWLKYGGDEGGVSNPFEHNGSSRNELAFRMLCEIYAMRNEAPDVTKLDSQIDKIAKALESFGVKEYADITTSIRGFVAKCMY
ncbi:MAG: hypothetical protein GJ680_18505 [Alteromonadaceae bacterium]|nr:hypothetical protein [Alteromonadaceae bacterium]